MTCARRPAGARTPAPSTSAGPRRPDARTGRARARRLSLLPVLALLLGALSLFAAAPALAQSTDVPGATLNLKALPGEPGTLKIWTQPPELTAGGQGVSPRHLGSRWTTGVDLHYTSAATSAVANDAAASGTNPSAAWVAWGDGGGRRPDLITGLTNGTKYRVRVRWHNRVGAGKWAHTTGTPQAQFDATAPTVRMLRPWVLNEVDLLWHDPVVASTPIDYEVHYTSAAESAAANGAAAVSGTDPATGWVDAKRTGSHVSRVHGATQNVFSFPAGHGFKRGTEYRFRVRGVYASFKGATRVANRLGNWGYTKFVFGAHTAVGLDEPSRVAPDTRAWAGRACGCASPSRCRAR